MRRLKSLLCFLSTDIENCTTSDTKRELSAVTQKVLTADPGFAVDNRNCAPNRATA